ncbi:MAG: RNA polymerase sigma factor [Myxococcota bacterium]
MTRLQGMWTTYSCETWVEVNRRSAAGRNRRMTWDEDFDSVCKRLGPALYGRCLKLLGNEADAEEICQEVLLRIYASRKSLPTIRDALYWGYRVSANLSLNRLRSMRRRRAFIERAASLEVVLDQTPENPEFEAQRQELLWLLAKRLPRRLLEPALLFYWDGMDQREVSETLGISRRTLVSRLTDFRERAASLLRSAS